MSLRSGDRALQVQQLGVCRMRARLVSSVLLAALFVIACRTTAPPTETSATPVSTLDVSAPVSQPSQVLTAPPARSVPEAGVPIAPREPKKHRVSSAACPQTRPPGSVPYPGFCKSDAECTDGKNGRCTPSGRRGGPSCTYDQCFSDSDCKGTVCECREGGASGPNVCKAGNCRTDADCKGSYCSPSLGSCGHFTGPVGYFCHGKDDECVDDGDCDGKEGACRFVREVGHFKCSTSECRG